MCLAIASFWRVYPIFWMIGFHSCCVVRYFEESIYNDSFRLRQRAILQTNVASE